MGPRMRPGTFLGYSYFSNTYRVAAENGDILKVRGILRRPMADRWNAETIKAIATTPWCLRTVAAPGRIELGERVPRHEPDREERAPNPRRLKITMRLLQEHGTTDGCPQCRHVRLFNETKPGLAHSEACRQRLVDAIQATPAGAQALERQEGRTRRAQQEHEDIQARQSVPQRPVQGGQEGISAPIDGGVHDNNDHDHDPNDDTPAHAPRPL